MISLEQHVYNRDSSIESLYLMRVYEKEGVSFVVFIVVVTVFLLLFGIMFIGPRVLPCKHHH